MEMAPVANIRETDIDINNRPTHDPELGVDDGFEGRSPNDGNYPRRNIPSGRGGFPISPGHGYNPLPANPRQPGNPIDVNLYQTKKTVAQGMMDIALLTANANQLRYVLETGKYGTNGALYYLNISLISISIILQLVVGVFLIFMGRYNVSVDKTARKADKLNNLKISVFFITVINVFISTFAVEPEEQNYGTFIKDVRVAKAA
ncbi:unnamed protein product, partial [Meganyctiphanes norvegica]